MRKSIIVILAVAIIGALGLYSKTHSSSSGPTSTSGSEQVAGSNISSSSSGSASAAYKDGTFTGASEQTPYGVVQVAAVVSGGKITNVEFLQMPSDMGHSQEVTATSEPILKEETLQTQSAHIDFVSGASSTSQGYMLSLQSALDQAA
jgi:uncharacterized protein with FMN-binding domain